MARETLSPSPFVVLVDAAQVEAFNEYVVTSFVVSRDFYTNDNRQEALDQEASKQKEKLHILGQIGHALSEGETVVVTPVMQEKPVRDYEVRIHSDERQSQRLKIGKDGISQLLVNIFPTAESRSPHKTPRKNAVSKNAALDALAANRSLIFSMKGSFC